MSSLALARSRPPGQKTRLIDHLEMIRASAQGNRLAKPTDSAEHDLPVIPAGGEQLSISRKGHGSNVSIEPSRPGRVAWPPIPDLDSPILSAHSDRSSRPREIELRPSPGEKEAVGSGFSGPSTRSSFGSPPADVPELGQAIVARREQGLAITGKAHGGDPAPMVADRLPQGEPAISRRPDARKWTLAACSGDAAIGRDRKTVETASRERPCAVLGQGPLEHHWPPCQGGTVVHDNVSILVNQHQVACGQEPTGWREDAGDPPRAAASGEIPDQGDSILGHLE